MMDKLVVKHRKKLNDQQLEVLELLYKFRFGSNDLIAQYFGKKDRSFVYKRLTILLEQGLIGKRFDASYRLQGKPAAYYLKPAGARALQEHSSSDEDEINIKAIYKDGSVSEQFVEHNLDLFAVYNQLRDQYGDDFDCFTKVNLNYEKFDYFPQPLPDAFIRLEIDGEEKQFFLDLYHDSQPFFTALRKIKRYIKYAEEGDWSATETSLPVILVVCDSPMLVKRLQKRIVKELDRAWADNEVVFALISKKELLGAEKAIWRIASDPDTDLKLTDIS